MSSGGNPAQLFYEKMMEFFNDRTLPSEKDVDVEALYAKHLEDKSYRALTILTQPPKSVEKQTVLHEASSRELEWQEAAKAENGFDIRGPLGNQWRLALAADAGLNEQYKSVGKSYHAQREFRKKWASEQAEGMKRKRMITETHVVEVSQYGRL